MYVLRLLNLVGKIYKQIAYALLITSHVGISAFSHKISDLCTLGMAQRSVRNKYGSAGVAPCLSVDL